MDQLAFYKKSHKNDRTFQFWQEGVHPELIPNDEMMKQKIDYIHQNPVKRGCVDEAEHWRYSVLGIIWEKLVCWRLFGSGKCGLHSHAEAWE